MEGEASLFESSEMLAALVASTPLLSNSWRLCSLANATAPRSFVSEQLGSTTYLAFSGNQALPGVDMMSFTSLVPMEAAGEGMFSPLLLPTTTTSQEEDNSPPPPPMVQAGVLQMFMNIYSCPTFRNQMLAIVQTSSSLVITGHSLGGPVASLSALWLLSYLHSVSSPLQVLCITFGTPFLGNHPLSRAILRERWGGNFIHVVAKHDIVPRLLLAPLPPPGTQLHHILLQFWDLLMASMHLGNSLLTQLPEHERLDLFRFLMVHAEGSTNEGDVRRCSFSPFGNYYFCSEEGAVCLDNADAIVRMLHLTMASRSATPRSIEDHLKYGDYVQKNSKQFTERRSIWQVRTDSNYEAGLEVALQSSGIASQDLEAVPVKNCLKIAKRLGRTPYLTPYLNSAKLAIGLSKITPYRAQIEWYKDSCDKSDDQMGYYDSFKQREVSKKHFKVNVNRIKLGQFWDELIQMLGTDQLPHDFSKRAKWVNASQFYKLLVEPLDIAEYYRSGKHRVKGHYLRHGRERRFEIFDRWWKEKEAGEEEINYNRSKYASLTQDSCFWAKLEEARDWVEKVRMETDAMKLALLWESIDKFELYASRLIECKEVSRDVLARNSSYSLWVEELRELKSQVMQIPPQFVGFVNGEVVP